MVRARESHRGNLRPYAGIGRQARLRSVCSDASEFDSRYGHSHSPTPVTPGSISMTRFLRDGVKAIGAIDDTWLRKNTDAWTHGRMVMQAALNRRDSGSIPDASTRT